jgi:hypothetical protein
MPDKALMERMDVSTNPAKQATGRLGEKSSRVKFSGAMSGEPEQSAFLALERERVALGVRALGKAA